MQDDRVMRTGEAGKAPGQARADRKNPTAREREIAALTEIIEGQCLALEGLSIAMAALSKDVKRTLDAARAATACLSARKTGRPVCPEPVPDTHKTEVGNND